MISFVYFDIGGVAIKDFSKTDKWLKMNQDLGINPSNQHLFEELWNSVKDRVDLDQDIDKLVPLLRTKVGLNLTDNFPWLDEFVDRFEPNYSLWSVIETIQKTAKVGLLTNMYPRMLDKIQGSGLLPPFNWDAIVDSSVVKVKKPDLGIYQIAQDRAGVNPHEILFVDNLQVNLDPAAALGWQTYLYDPADYQQSSDHLSAFLSTSEVE